MISKANPYIVDKRTQNKKQVYDEVMSQPNYPVDNYLFNLIDCTRKFTNQSAPGSKYEGRYFMSDNLKHVPKENDRNRQRKNYRTNFNTAKDCGSYFISNSKNLTNESEKEKQIRNLFNKHPYVFKSLEKTSLKTNNNVSNTHQFTTSSYIRPDQLPFHKFLKITYDKKFNNANYVPTFLREPSLEAMEAMNHVLYGNMFYVGKQSH